MPKCLQLRDLFLCERNPKAMHRVMVPACQHIQLQGQIQHIHDLLWFDCHLCDARIHLGLRLFG